MTKNEFGLKLRAAYPKLNDVPLNNEELAQYILNKYPHLYDILSPTARKLKELSDTPIHTEKSFWDSNEDFYKNEAQNIQNRRSVIASVHEADMMMKASMMGVPVTALHEIAVAEHQTKLTMELERFRTYMPIDAGNAYKLSPHQQIDLLNTQLNDLIDRRDKESHPDKRRALSTRIKYLQEELDARGQQTVVQAGGGSGPRDSENTKGAGVDGTSYEGDVEPVPSAKPRMGFRR